jgi:chromosome segregation ATPase
LKTQTLEKGGSSIDSGADANSKLIRDERDHLMELMKRNHDIVVEKYEVQRQRNESLEKLAIEKERLYNEIKIENDQISNNNYKLQRAIEELLNEKRILDGKFKNADAQLRQTQDELRFTRVTLDKAETTCKVIGEQLDNAKRALEEVSVKKQQEIDMLSKEL